MNGALYHHTLTQRVNRFMKWPLLCGLLSLILARAALATDALWPPADQLDQVFNYTVPGNPPPTIDATAFDIENQFTVNFSATVLNPEFFEPWNTVNYTNNGLMVANAPISITGIFLTFSPGCGFEFDTQTTNANSPQMAGTFYNAGTIRVNSLSDNINASILSTVGKVIVSATNVTSSGTVDVGVNGLIQFTGQSVDLTRSTFAVEQSGNFVSGVGAFGVDTNDEWDPSFDLGPTFALSSLPFAFLLPNSTAYFNVAANGASNNIIRCVFIQDFSVPGPNESVAFNVYFDSTAAFGGGNATVEWVGSYVDWATGGQQHDYLYLNDNYALGASTNVLLTATGIPDNFTFTESPTRLLPGNPANPGFLNLFPAGAFTNVYSYALAQITSTSVATNASISNPSGALTNLPGRIQINSQGNLNLGLAQISGPNYLSVQATNQFNGSAGARITSPYSDVNLGVTNGFLTVSNLLQTQIPNWSGVVEAWSTRFISIVNGVTNDFRVEIVGSQLNPTTVAQVQDLFLHSTNLVLSDTMNLLRNIRIDATSLTTTTNHIAVGATSPEGELNWQASGTFGTAAQFPNLRWVTNNGALMAANSASFGSSAAYYGAFINNSLMVDQGTAIYSSNFVNGGVISNGVGGFTLQSLTTTLTNGSITAGGRLAITTVSLVTSNVMLTASNALNLTATNLLTDTGVTNGNFWTVGRLGPGAGQGVYLNNGFNLPIKPLVGDLLGTTVTNIAHTNILVNNLWAGVDRGSSPAGYSNNAAVGRLTLDAMTSSVQGAQFYFSGTGASNAIYVDRLSLNDFASYTNHDANGNIPTLNFNTNLVIYYADAVASGIEVSEKLNGANGNHLRWVPSYAGYFSSTNLVYPDGTTNTVNIALAESTDIDSDQDGIVNASDPTPFFVPNEVKFTLTLTNISAMNYAKLSWQSIPSSTNSVFYNTNLVVPNWQVLTNFVTVGSSSPTINTVLDKVNPVSPRYYRVLVSPNNFLYYGF